MANCDICGKPFVLFDTGSGFSYNPETGKSDFTICNECYAKIEKLRQLDKEQYELFYEKLYVKNGDGITNQKIIVPLKELMEENKPLFNHTQNKLLNNYQKIESFVTSGYNFEGYKIKKYGGMITGESVLGTRWSETIAFTVSTALEKISTVYPKKLKSAKQKAIEYLMDEAIAKNCNAIIGLDFDYITLYADVIGVIANGTAVVIEKIED